MAYADMKISSPQQTTVNMSNPQTTNRKTVSDLEENLRRMPDDMRLFSVSLRSLYATKTVRDSTDVARKFRALRDNTRQDAILYMECFLPISIKFVSSIEKFFVNYSKRFRFEEWCKMLPDIREEATTIWQVAQTVLEMHEELMTSLKKREDEAKVIMSGFKNLQREFEDKREEFERAAKRKNFLATLHLFIPGVNLIAYPLLKSLAKENTVEAIAAGEESKINEAAADVVANTLIPALSHFIEGLSELGSFFQNLERDLQSIESQAITALKWKVHYKKTAYKSAEIISLCQAFYAAMPDVRTDLKAIPTEDTDQNYIDRWLKKQLAELQKESKAQKFILDVFKGGKAAIKRA